MDGRLRDETASCGSIVTTSILHGLSRSRPYFTVGSFMAEFIENPDLVGSQRSDSGLIFRRVHSRAQRMRSSARFTNSFSQSVSSSHMRSTRHAVW